MFNPKLLMRCLKVSVKEERMSTRASAAMIARDHSLIRIKLCGEAEGQAALMFRMITEKTEVDAQSKLRIENADTAPRKSKTC